MENENEKLVSYEGRSMQEFPKTKPLENEEAVIVCSDSSYGGLYWMDTGVFVEEELMFPSSNHFPPV